MVDLGVADESGPRLLGVYLSCVRNYATLDDIELEPARKDRVFFGLLGARIALASLRAVLQLHGLSYPEDVAKVRIANLAEVGLPDSRLPSDGKQLFEWAVAHEATICDAIDSFGGMKVKLMQDFTEIRDVPDSVWDLRVDGETPLYDAITQSADALAQRPERRRAILVVSDGADTKSKATLDQALRKTLDAQASIYAVDLSDASVYKAQPRDTGAQIMKEMAAKTGGKFYPSAGGSELRDAFTKTIDELRQQYTLTYESTNEKYDGKWRVVEVKVAKPLVNVRTRQGYYAKKQKS